MKIIRAILYPLGAIGIVYFLVVKPIQNYNMKSLDSNTQEETKIGPPPGKFRYDITVQIRTGDVVPKFYMSEIKDFHPDELAEYKDDIIADICMKELVHSDSIIFDCVLVEWE